MTVDEFAATYPQFAIDFTQPIRDQQRILEPFILDQLPIELDAVRPYHAGSRGRPNLNQTRTHRQCGECKRILRNDLFYTPPSMLRKNLVFTHCRDCTHKKNSERYDANAKLIQARRIAVWQYLAPACALCGFSAHVSALDMHHRTEKDFLVAELITAVTFTPKSHTIEKLLYEASKCIPLCSNCHRMVHAGVLALPDSFSPPQYSLNALLRILKTLED